MHFISLQVIAVIVTITSMSSTLYADTQTQEEHYKSICVESWMSRAGENSDKVNFRNFGEKYCQCGIRKALKDENDLKNMEQQCMSETLTQAVMTVVDDKQGWSSTSATGFETACQNEWKLVYPQMNEENKKTTISHCQCVAPKLYELNRSRGTLTSNQFVDKLNVIADHCATFITVGDSQSTA